MYYKEKKIKNKVSKLLKLLQRLKPWLSSCLNFSSPYLCIQNQTEKLDAYFRNLINQKLGGLSVSRITFLKQVKDGLRSLFFSHQIFNLKFEKLEHLVSFEIGGVMKNNILQVA
jgi:hypothetical protein